MLARRQGRRIPRAQEKLPQYHSISSWRYGTFWLKHSSGVNMHWTRRSDHLEYA